MELLFGNRVRSGNRRIGYLAGVEVDAASRRVTKIITEQTKETMRQLLRDIQSGEFAKKWIAENENGLPNFKTFRERDRTHQIEIVGTQLRAMMPFLDPVTVKQGVAV